MTAPAVGHAHPPRITKIKLFFTCFHALCPRHSHGGGIRVYVLKKLFTPSDRIKQFVYCVAQIIIIKKLGGKGNIVYKPLPKDDPTQRRPDITLAKEKLGWEPKIALDEGLDKTIAYFQQVLGGEL